MILDCCYSGRAMDGFMASSLEVADQAQIEACSTVDMSKPR